MFHIGVRHTLTNQDEKNQLQDRNVSKDHLLNNKDSYDSCHKNTCNEVTSRSYATFGDRKNNLSIACRFHHTFRFRTIHSYCVTSSLTISSSKFNISFHPSSNILTCKGRPFKKGITFRNTIGRRIVKGAREASCLRVKIRRVTNRLLSANNKNMKERNFHGQFKGILTLNCVRPTKNKFEVFVTLKNKGNDR